MYLDTPDGALAAKGVALRFRRRTGLGGGAGPALRGEHPLDWDVRVTKALPTPGRPATVRSTVARSGSASAARDASTSSDTKTRSSRTTTPPSAPDRGSGVRPSGPMTPASAATTSS